MMVINDGRVNLDRAARKLFVVRSRHNSRLMVWVHRQMISMSLVNDKGTGKAESNSLKRVNYCLLGQIKVGP